MSWYQEAQYAINEAIKNCNDFDLKKAIDNAYPFGERKYFPYKAWLKARKDAFIRLGIVPMPLSKKEKERQFELSKTNGLFEINYKCENCKFLISRPRICKNKIQTIDGLLPLDFCCSLWESK